MEDERGKLYEKFRLAYVDAHFDIPKAKASRQAASLWNKLNDKRKNDDDSEIIQTIQQMEEKSKIRKSQNILAWAKFSTSNC